MIGTVERRPSRWFNLDEVSLFYFKLKGTLGQFGLMPLEIRLALL